MRNPKKFLKGLVISMIYFITGLFFTAIFCIGLVVCIKLAIKLQNSDELLLLLFIAATLGTGVFIAIGTSTFEKIGDCRCLNGSC